MIKYDKTKWVDGTTVLRASHMEKIEKGITDIIDYNSSIYTDEAKRKENEIKREEEHNKRLEEINKSINDIQTDYDSLQKVIIDENASANLQNQINNVNSQLAQNMNYLDVKKLDKSGIVTMANMGQDVKEAMTGGSVAVVGKNSILTENIVDYQVTNNKLNLPVNDLLPRTFKYEIKGINTNTGAMTTTKYRVATPDKIFFKKGATLCLKDKENTKYLLVYYDSEDNFIRYTSYRDKDITFESDVYVRIMQKYSDSDTHAIEDVDFFSNNVYVIDENTAINKMQVLNMVEESKKEINNTVEESKEEINSYINDLEKILIDNTELCLKSAKVVKSKGEFTINGGSYHKVTITPEKGTYYAMVRTNDTEGKYKDLISISIYKNSTSTKGLTLFLGNGKYLCRFENDNAEVEGEFRFFLDFRKADEPVIIKQYEVYFIGLNENNSKTFYVSPTGSDDNSGISSEFPLKTFQKAINLGATKIFAKDGKYYGQSIVASNLEELEIVVVSDVIDSETRVKAKAVICNGEELDVTFNDSTGLYCCEKTVDESHNYYKVFISKELEPEAPHQMSVSYNAILWETNKSDFTKDTKLLPVLTLSDCETTKGSFYYDGSHIYINPLNDDENNTYVCTIASDNSQSAIRLTNINRLCLQDIEVAYPSNVGFTFANINNATLTSCISHHTSYGSGFKIDNTNANFYNCKSYKSRIDGFGILSGGNTNFYDCFGFYNYDDGISHHGACTGVIDGGEWHHNGKGGISPAHGCIVDVKNTICHNNDYGLYCSSSMPNSVKGLKVRHYNAICYDNRVGVLVQNYHVTAFNCKYDNNEIPKSVQKNEFGSYTEL